MKVLQIDKDVQEIIRNYGKAREYLVPMLQEIVAKKGYLTEDLVRSIAEEMNLSSNEVYSVATFYSFINTTPKGKYVVRICRTISCDMAGKNDIIKALEKELGVKMGSTTKDNKFTLEETNCIGMCDQGPAMLVNDQVYSKLNAKKAVEVIKQYKKQR